MVYIAGTFVDFRRFQDADVGGLRPVDPAGRDDPSSASPVFDEREPRIPPNGRAHRGLDADASAEDAAAYIILSSREDSFTHDPLQVAGVFAGHVSAHRDDAAWLGTYFQALGSDLVSEYVDLGLVSATYRSPWGDFDAVGAQAAVEGIPAALQTLHESGRLSDADVATLVENWALETGAPNLVLAQAIAELPGADRLELAFADAAIELALDDDHPRLADHDRVGLAAAATQVLGRAHPSDRADRLVELQRDGELTPLLELAVAAGPRHMSIDFWEAVHSGDDSAGHFELDGVARLIDSTIVDRYAPWNSSHLTSGERKALHAEMFLTVANALDRHEGQWEDDTRIKDALSLLVLNGLDSIVAAGLSENGRQMTPEARNAFSTYSEQVLFSETGGVLRDEASERLASAMNRWSGAIAAGDDTRLGDRTLEPGQLANVIGETLGSLVNGLDQATSDAIDERARQEAFISFVVDMGFALIPPGRFASSATGRFVKELVGVGQNELEELTARQLKELLLDGELPGLERNELISSLFDDIAGTIEVEDEVFANLLASYNLLVVNPELRTDRG